MEVTFHDVIITIEAPTPRAAYAHLATLLSASSLPLEFVTSTYSKDGSPWQTSVVELWGGDEDERASREITQRFGPKGDAS